MAKTCVHYFVSGTVQGVFYRDSTRRKARQLGLIGWVRNSSDGRVELIACGDKESIAQLETWLWQGPPAANVTAVSRTEIPSEDYVDFIVL
jgi:acylphosphatase